MFSSMFDVFLVLSLLCIIASGLYDPARPQAALFARCLGVLSITALLLCAVIALITGGMTEIIVFMGNPLVLLLCLVADISQRVLRRVVEVS